MRLNFFTVTIVGVVLTTTLPASPNSFNQSLSGTPLPRPVTIAEELSLVPSALASGQTVVVIWTYESANGIGWIAYRYSTNGGLSFGPSSKVVRVKYPRGLKTSMANKLVHMCWQDQLLPGQVFYAHIDLATGNASLPIHLSHGTTKSDSCRISASNKVVFVSWQNEVAASDHRLMGVVSADQGTTFSSPIEFARFTQPGGAWTSNATHGSTALISWDANDTEGRKSSIALTTLNTPATTFSKPLILSPPNENNYQSNIVASNGGVIVFWNGSVFDRNPGGIPNTRTAIVMRRSNNEGISFLPPLIVATPPRELPLDYSIRSKALIGNGTDWYLVWQESRWSPHSDRIYFSCSWDGGASFSESRSLGENLDQPQNLRIFSTRNKVIVTWQEVRDDQLHLILRASADRGKSFGEARNTPFNVAKGNGGFSNVMVFANEDSLFCVWIEPQREWREDLLQFLRLPLD